MKKLLFLGFVSSAFSLQSLAHEGHGHTHGFTITHYFVEPGHLAVLAGVLAAGIFFFRSYFQKKKKA
jgi:hypothetical protein